MSDGKNQHPTWRVIQGDARAALCGLEAETADCVVTSPPYFGHRKYGGDDSPGEIGRESDLGEYIANLRDVFAEVKRVLRQDGTLWLNLGDTFRHGELLGVPWQVAFALQADGWRLRSDVIWHKPNAMPSSVKSRPTTDHEYLFLFSLVADYHYDADAIREPHVTFSENSRMKGGRNHFGKRGGTPEEGKNGGNPNLHNARWDQAFHPLGRNRRTVWSVPLGKFREAHFAVFPEKLIEPCILAGSRKGGTVLDPFAGASTTGVVALGLGRSFLGTELVQEYCDLSEERLRELTRQGILFTP